ncbi:lytic transglycosylase domain-containing protein [Streptomyces sp. TLI_171]|uniref:lytic transglycosylase domain-containing protein n=1 Tax=Streptomyces sp. TLI_171 TaxID=1938859 RepID=UPI000C197F23|nr:lytic transglycosylase domain-containing protein [Streptomyces sp. TLI_171]RKE19256.1 soluble lytic murein transglycosylase-like protein [Streptomyces sp. TLI_171]
MTIRTPVRAALCLLSAAAVLVPVAGCAKKNAPSDDHTAAAAAPSDLPATPGPTDSAPASAPPSTVPSASPSASASATAKPSRSATPTRATSRPPTAAPAPVAKAGPVAPPPPAVPPHTPPLQSSCKPSYTGTNLPKADVAAALTAAAGTTRTFTLSAPSGGRTTDTLPPLSLALVKAIAWQESGWQSAIKACDGGIGTMQIMPGTATTMNNKYGTSSDVNTLAGNVQIGTQYLDWLVAYYGDSCFGGNYDLSPDPVSGKTPLLDLVIAAYNAGAGNVHYNVSTDPTTGAEVGVSVIPNPSYVANVKALMTKAPWTTAS